MDDVQRFLMQHKHHGGKAYAPRTRERYRYCLELLLTTLTEQGKDLATLGINDYLTYIEGNKWGANTARLHSAAMRAFVHWKYGEDHPLLQINLPREDSRPGRVLNNDKLNRLLSTFNTGTGKGWRDLAIISLMVETGVRANEIATLEIDNLDLVRCRMVVFAKGQRWQQKIFSRDTAQTLAMWLAWRERLAKASVKTVFVSVGGNTPGEALTRYGVSSIFRYVSKKVGFKISPHDLRRTFATLMIEAGAPTRVVQELGGWSNIREVERYTQGLTIDDIEAYSPIARRLNINQLNPKNYPQDGSSSN